MPDARLRQEYKEKYLRPAVEHDPQGAADLVDRWRAPHENAAAQLKRRATAFDDMTAHSAAEMLDLLESQRTGDETI